jgi:hypothetical protein
VTAKDVDDLVNEVYKSALRKIHDKRRMLKPKTATKRSENVSPKDLYARRF